MTLNDQRQRAQATNPAQSFIVQAPAGSGKTEMLSQRFLRLLATVQAPEQIVALTFTRKAAAEMRERIINALQRANLQTPVNSAHQQQTHRWAEQALQHSKRLDWQLLKQPHRLRIMTIDALCQQICRAMPLQEQSVPFANVTDNSHSYYQQAARSCIRYAIENSATREPILQVLAHLDNNQGKLIELFCQLLSNREQWLALILSAGLRSREEFENDLRRITQHELERFQSFFDADLERQLLHLLHAVAKHSQYKDGALECIITCQRLKDIDYSSLQALLDIVLTKQDRLRSQYDHNIGFKKDLVDEDTYHTIKIESARMQSLLKEIPGLEDHLARLRKLPEPFYQDEHWGMLQNLLALLPLLAAHLQLLFSESAVVDFSAVSQQANQALGEDEHPADLALYFDNRIMHLLVDEFQDTSITQFELIRKLLLGWQENDGRTLFLVGDPMQSIYRFRQAEVGLFLKARQMGIASVSLTPLELKTNFRSSQTIVDWVNEQFTQIFPRKDDIQSGAIRYHRSEAFHPEAHDSFVSARSFCDSKAEALDIVETVRKELLRDATQSIAILVRSRSHLLDILDSLRQANIPFQGVDIELLGRLPHIQDAWSLCKALLFPANRLAWLSLLRSPFCGIGLQDIHTLVSDHKRRPFLAIMENLAKPASMSENSWRRLQVFCDIMRTAIAQRHQYKLVEHLALILQQLGAPRLFDAKEYADIEQLWTLLEKFEQNNILSEVSHIEQGLQSLYAQQSKPAALQIMTIHKSKGLEFDTVLLPHLGSRKKTADKPLIRWLHLPQKSKEPLFLLAPLKAEYETQSPMYDFLQSLDQEKSDYENQRLLYVAITRAKKRLYLYSHKEKPEKGSLHFLLPRVDFSLQAPAQASPLDQSYQRPLMERLPLANLPSSLQATLSNQHAMIIHQRSFQPTAAIGTLCHSLLQWSSEQQLFEVARLPWVRVQNELINLGLPKAQQIAIMRTLTTLMQKTFENDRARWILQAHPLAYNEHRFMEALESGYQLKIPDRFFQDEKGDFWVVDFKSGQRNGQQSRLHRKQVNDYAKLLQRLYEQPQIQCGLYYLDSQYWDCWTYNLGHQHDLT